MAALQQNRVGQNGDAIACLKMSLNMLRVCSKEGSLYFSQMMIDDKLTTEFIEQYKQRLEGDLARYEKENDVIYFQKVGGSLTIFIYCQ